MLSITHQNLLKKLEFFFQFVDKKNCKNQKFSRKKYFPKFGKIFFYENVEKKNLGKIFFFEKKFVEKKLGKKIFSKKNLSKFCEKKFRKKIC